MRDRFDDQSVVPFPSLFSCRICHFEILSGDRFGGWDAFVLCRERSDINPLKIFALSSWQFWKVSSTIITWMMNDRVQSYATRIEENSALMRYPNQAIGSRPLATIGSCPWVPVVEEIFVFQTGFDELRWTSRFLFAFFSYTRPFVLSADSGHGGKRNQIARLANVIQSSLLDGSHSTANCGRARTRRTRTTQWSHVTKYFLSEVLFWIDTAESGQFLHFEPQDFRIWVPDALFQASQDTVHLGFQ